MLGPVVIAHGSLEGYFKKDEAIQVKYGDYPNEYQTKRWRQSGYQIRVAGKWYPATPTKARVSVVAYLLLNGLSHQDALDGADI